MSDDKHDKALDLTEKALDALEDGNQAVADKLLDQAKTLDPSAIEEVVEDLGDAEGKA
jgi:phage shock protein A